MANANLELTEVINATVTNQRVVSGTINNQRSVNGTLSMPSSIEFVAADYEELENIPTINGIEIRGESSDLVMTSTDELSNLEISAILR